MVTTTAKATNWDKAKESGFNALIQWLMTNAVLPFVTIVISAVLGAFGITHFTASQKEKAAEHLKAAEATAAKSQAAGAQTQAALAQTQAALAQAQANLNESHQVIVRLVQTSQPLGQASPSPAALATLTTAPSPVSSGLHTSPASTPRHTPASLFSSAFLIELDPVNLSTWRFSEPNSGITVTVASVSSRGAVVASVSFQGGSDERRWQLGDSLPYQKNGRKFTLSLARVDQPRHQVTWKIDETPL